MRVCYIFRFYSFIELINIFIRVNFVHKELLLRAEAARVSLYLGSSLWLSSIDDFINGVQLPTENLDFKEAMDLYERAIESASRFGFTQYEALGTVLFLFYF